MAKRRASERTRGAPPAKAGKRRRNDHVVANVGGLTVTEVAELSKLRRHIERTASGRSPLRWNADPDEVQRSVAVLVLTLVEFIRRLLERQAIRRMDAGTLTPRQIEDIGRGLMELERTIHDLAARFGVSPEELQLDLGPVGRLM